jgi:hypothetical protein
MDLMDTDRCWLEQKSLSDKQGLPLELWVIKNLGGIQCDISLPYAEEPEPAPEPKPAPYVAGSPDAREHQPPQPPSPATGVKVRITHQSPFHHAPVIVETLEWLADVKHLDAANQAAPYRFGYKIQSWKVRLGQMIDRNKHAWTVQGAGQEKHRKDSPVSAVPGATTFSDQALTYLTVADVRELAHFQPLDAAAVEDLLLDPVAVLPSTGVPISRAVGGAILEVAITLCVLYYWLMNRENRQYGAKEVPATLFTVFRRTTTSRVIFFLMALVPAYAVIHLAYLRVTVPSSWGRPLKVLDVVTGVLVSALCVVIVATEPWINEEVRRLQGLWQSWRARRRPSGSST